MSVKNWLWAAVLGLFMFCSAGGSALQAGEAAVKTFQKAAYSADFSGGADRLSAMVHADRNDTEALFGLATLRFFGAIAELQKDLYGHATPISSRGGGRGWASGLIPMSRMMGGVLLVPPNPKATPMTYGRLREILATFVERLEVAERTLARVGDRPVKLPLRPFDIALDLDHNGTIEQHERILVNLLSGSRRRMREAAFGAELAFDATDASWLRGYTHVLLTAVNFVLAFDFEKTYGVAAHNLYGDAATAFGLEMARQAQLGRPREEIQAELDKVTADISSLRKDRVNLRDIRELRKHLRELPDTPQNAEQRRLYENALKTMTVNQKTYRERMAKLYREQRRLRSERDGPFEGWVFDLVAAVHTLSWDVVEPQRLKSARVHLLRVMEINRNTWRLARLETDDDREWLPNAKQTPPFGGKPGDVTDAIIDSWLATTALAAEVLRGEKLVPHPRFNKGINLKRVFDEAKRVDFILIATGHDLVPFLEDGEVVDQKAWSAITQPMGREFGKYAIWFN